LTLITSLEKGQKLDKQHISLKRPGTGLFFRDLQNLLGRKAKKSLLINHQIKYEDFE